MVDTSVVLERAIISGLLEGSQLQWLAQRTFVADLSQHGAQFTSGTVYY